MLKMMLELKPDLTLTNKKGQTAIDITSSKIIISLFWHYLNGNGGDVADKTAPLKDYSQNPLKPSAPASPVSTTQKIVINLPSQPNPSKTKYVLKDLRIKAPELAKIPQARPKEKKGLLIGPRPIKKFVLFCIQCRK